MGNFCGMLGWIFQLYILLLIARALLSWINPNPYNPIIRVIYQLTEPVLAPFRRYIPPVGMFDISFLVAFIVLEIVFNIILQLVGCRGGGGLFGF
ncbi:MAG: YggT family protein [Anaerolineae bacterium]